MDNLIEMVGQQFTPELIRRIGGLVGESPEATGKALSALAPALVCNLSDKAATRTGSEQILATLNQYQGQRLDNLASNPLSLPTTGAAADTLMQTGLRPAWPAPWCSLLRRQARLA